MRGIREVFSVAKCHLSSSVLLGVAKLGCPLSNKIPQTQNINLTCLQLLQIIKFIIINFGKWIHCITTTTVRKHIIRQLVVGFCVFCRFCSIIIVVNSMQIWILLLVCLAKLVVSCELVVRSSKFCCVEVLDKSSSTLCKMT